MMSTIYQFFMANGYVFELMLAVALLCGWMDRRSYFIPKVVGGIIIFLVISVCWNFLPAGNVWMDIMRTILFCAYGFVGIYACFKITFAQAIFYMTAVELAQHFTFRVSRTIQAFVGIAFHTGEIFAELFYPISQVLLLFFVYLLFGKKLRNKDGMVLGEAPVILLMLMGMQLCTNIFQNLFDVYAVNVGHEVYVIYSLFDIICCLCLLALQCEIIRNVNEHHDNEILKYLLYQQKQQMKMSKENIELINIKCHDIKNQIAALGNRVPEEEIKELTRAIDIYDTAFKTGNEAIDVLMIEKLMVCENKNIHFDCMIDGDKFGFMKAADIYAFFGNAIDNAIEAVEHIEDEEKRCISVKAHIEKGMLMVHFQNFYEGTLEFEENLPQTTKKDKDYHGFGMKSIRMITEKYHGYLSVRAENSVFTLNVLLPLHS